MNSTQSESILLEAVLRGETEKFEELVRRCQTMVLRYFLLSHPREEAEDLTQETFLQAWRALRTYSPQWKFSTWILAIAHQQNALFFRKKDHSIQSKMSAAEIDLNELDSAVSSHADFQRIAEDEEAQNLWQLIRADLPAEQAEILWLFYVEEKSCQEIAHVQDRTASAVKSILFRARKALQKLLHWKFAEEPFTDHQPSKISQTHDE